MSKGPRQSIATLCAAGEPLSIRPCAHAASAVNLLVALITRVLKLMFLPMLRTVAVDSPRVVMMMMMMMMVMTVMNVMIVLTTMMTMMMMTMTTRRSIRAVVVPTVSGTPEAKESVQTGHDFAKGLLLGLAENCRLEACCHNFRLTAVVAARRTTTQTRCSSSALRSYGPRLQTVNSTGRPNPKTSAPAALAV